MAKRNNGNDISKEVVVVFLVIAILVSVIGTWTVFDSVNSFDVSPNTVKQPTKQPTSPANTVSKDYGNVKMVISPAPETTD